MNSVSHIELMKKLHDEEVNTIFMTLRTSILLLSLLLIDLGFIFRFLRPFTVFKITI